MSSPLGGIALGDLPQPCRISHLTRGKGIATDRKDHSTKNDRKREGLRAGKEPRHLFADIMHLMGIIRQFHLFHTVKERVVRFIILTFIKVFQ